MSCGAHVSSILAQAEELAKAGIALDPRLGRS